MKRDAAVAGFYEQAALDKSYAKLVDRWKEAQRLEADRLAKPLFEQAQARHLEGDRLREAKDLKEAARVYEDAAARYEAAIRRVRDGQ